MLESIQKTPAKATDDLRHLVIYGLPKIGKTTICSQLPDCLIIGFEKGIDYVEGYKVRIRKYNELKEVLKDLMNDTRFKFVVFDTVTTMLEVLKEKAEEIFASTSMGKNWFTTLKHEYKDILNLPKGAGYGYVKEALVNIMDFLDDDSKFKLPKNYIWIAHSKDTVVDTVGGYDIRFKDIDLPANIKSALSVRAGAIGYAKRNNNKVELSFITNNEYLAGCQVEDLSGRILTISEKTDDGTIKTYWNNVYKKLAVNK